MVDTPKFAEIKETQPLKGKLVVITGTSRGIGSRVAVLLAEAGAHIVGTHATPSARSESRQEAVRREIGEVNPNAIFESVLADVTVPEDRKLLVESAAGGDQSASRTIDILVLNAAGGLEDGKAPDWADRINHEAQIALVKEFLPHMSRGAVIIYNQSLPSHFYGRTRQFAMYEPVARTKFAAERELREMIPELEAHGVRVGFIVGDLIRGTSGYSLFKATFRDGLNEIAGVPHDYQFPDANEYARALRDMVLAPGESGFTRFVGRGALEPFDETIFGKQIGREQILEMLPMYNDNSLYVDSFRVIDMNSGEAVYRTRVKDFEGHFGGDFREMKVMPGHFITEMAAQSAGLVVARTRILGSGIPLFNGVEAEFVNMAFPEEELRTVARFERAVSGRIICSAEVFGQDGSQVAKFDRISFLVLPTKELGRRFYRMNRVARGLAPSGETSKDTSE